MKSIIKRRQIKILVLLIFTLAMTNSIIKAGTYDFLFSSSNIKDLLLNETGRYIIKLIHPASRHSSTSLISKRGNVLKFETKYKGWTRAHRLVWMIELSDRTILSDFRFISDTSKFPSARYANQSKDKIVQLIKYYYRKYSR